MVTTGRGLGKWGHEVKVSGKRYGYRSFTRDAMVDSGNKMHYRTKYTKMDETSFQLLRGSDSHVRRIC